MERKERELVYLQEEVEEINQQIYHYKNQFDLAGALKADYLQEIELLNDANAKEVDQMQREIEELQERIAATRNAQNAKLLANSELIQKLSGELEEKRKVCETKKDNGHEEMEGEQLQNVALKTELNVAKDSLREFEANIDCLNAQITTSEQIKKNLIVELESQKNNYLGIVQELSDVNKLIQETQEDILVNRLENEFKENKPLDVDSKGNSLFAEVEDSRVKTQQAAERLKKNYSQMENELSGKLKEMKELIDENLQLSRNLESVEKNDEHSEKLIEELKEQISKLDAEIANYKMETLKTLNCSEQNFSGFDVDCANLQIKLKWSAGEKHREELFRRSKENLDTAIKIHGAQTEIHRLQQNVMLLKMQIKKMENDIFEFQHEPKITTK